MKPLALFVCALALVSRAAGAENIREESLRLIEQDAKSGGKSAPKDSRTKRLKKDAFDAAGSDVVVLPKIEITAKKSTELDFQLGEMEKREKREEKASESSLLDSILNPAFFGGASSGARAREAQRRVEAIDDERILLISLAEAKSAEEKERIKADIDLLKGLVR
jgi:hypothetical protein